MLSVSRIWPVQDLTVSPAPQGAERSGATDHGRTRRRRRTIPTLVDEAVLEDGAILTFRTADVPPRFRQRVAQWIAEDPQRGQAEWRNDERAPLTWSVDGLHRLPTTLAKEIVERATGTRPSHAGPWWWDTDDGTNLGALASEVSGRDWSDLHGLLEGLQPGEWTTYGDLAEIIDSVAIAVGAHIKACDHCPSAHRVLNAERRHSRGFQWTNPDDKRKPAEVLAGEGVPFTEDGRADESRRLAVSVLRERL